MIPARANPKGSASVSPRRRLALQAEHERRPTRASPRPTTQPAVHPPRPARDSPSTAIEAESSRARSNGAGEEHRRAERARLAHGLPAATPMHRKMHRELERPDPYRPASIRHRNRGPHLIAARPCRARACGAAYFWAPWLAPAYSSRCRPGSRARVAAAMHQDGGTCLDRSACRDRAGARAHGRTEAAGSTRLSQRHPATPAGVVPVPPFADRSPAPPTSCGSRPLELPRHRFFTSEGSRALASAARRPLRESARELACRFHMIPRRASCAEDAAPGAPELSVCRECWHANCVD